MNEVEHIYVINLDKDTENLEKFTKQVGESFSYTRIKGVEPLKGNQNLNKGQLGCLSSHILILEDAIKNNYKKILIFEDDIILKDSWEKIKNALNNLQKLVVKEVHGSGGYGLLIGSKSSKKEIEVFKKKIETNPSNYIAQPILELSSVPIFSKKELSPRHVDLRPFCLVGAKKTKLVSGGLTRVALKKGSLVVNSSQGGGVKDTWVINE